MTTKIMKSLKWITKYCSNAKYILRINDDVVVNTHHLIEHFANKPYELNQIFGYGIYGVGPIRSQDDKFHVSEQDYSPARYDDYIEGKKKRLCFSKRLDFSRFRIDFFQIFVSIKKSHLTSWVN
jgi:hypothetical protein